jgi:hypothetical protein
MPVSPRLASLLSLGLLAAFLAGPALAADTPHRVCLNKTEQRLAVADRRAVPLAQAVKSTEKHGHQTELLRARLCHRGTALVYELTMLSAKGKVTHANVDAVNGMLIKNR